MTKIFPKSLLQLKGIKRFTLLFQSNILSYTQNPNTIATRLFRSARRATAAVRGRTEIERANVEVIARIVCRLLCITRQF